MRYLGKPKFRQKANMQRFICTGLLMFFGILAQAQELNTILKKHFEGYGQSMWDQIETVSITGHWIFESFEKYPIKLTYKSDGKVRIEGVWKGSKFVEVTNGFAAWKVAPWSGSTDIAVMNAEERMVISNIYQKGSPLAMFQEGMVLEGLELFEGKMRIKLRSEDSRYVRFYYLGKEDYRLYGEVVRSKEDADLELTLHFEKYKSFHGLLAPTAVKASINNNLREFALEEYALGIGASDSLFELPKNVQK
jgi:hypothetical protein